MRDFHFSIDAGEYLTIHNDEQGINVFVSKNVDQTITVAIGNGEIDYLSFIVDENKILKLTGQDHTRQKWEIPYKILTQSSSQSPASKPTE